MRREADAVATDGSGQVLALGSCRWATAPVDVSELDELRRIAGAIAPGRRVSYVIYARSGVDDRIRAEQEADPESVHVVAVPELLAG